MEISDGSCSTASMSCTLGDLSQPDGSASLTHGNTQVAAAVYGPCEVRLSKEFPDRATIEVIHKPKVGLPRCEDKLRETLLRSIFETAALTALHPRSSIQIIIQEIEDQGGLLATSINAACLALLDASISMKFLVAAVTAKVKHDGSVLLLPQEGSTEKDSLGIITFVFREPDKSVVCSFTSVGTLSLQQRNQCLSLCQEACDTVFKFYRECLENKFSKIK
ncbi:hypothetical protein C0Q70_00525 [Pomacea canaliculata]|uniref:Exoribonuclease phosphorolytic domain-containing protein n=1 Tax=Pomacea canaliculata TaxID=400727 RepID=A0A2T7PWW5_POMCA|nr:exosome complex component RRP46-like [Pomacea canaliculata]PVD37923.1 hypothetical protein C0Q70_00525 [Pomacea canaliculata]